MSYHLAKRATNSIFAKEMKGEKFWTFKSTTKTRKSERSIELENVKIIQNIEIELLTTM